MKKNKTMILKICLIYAHINVDEISSYFSRPVNSKGTPRYMYGTFLLQLFVLYYITIFSILFLKLPSL